MLVLPHTNHIKIYDVVDKGGKVETKEMDVKWNGLPFLSGFISEKGLLYVGGYDKKVAVFNRSARNCVLTQKDFHSPTSYKQIRNLLK